MAGFPQAPATIPATSSYGILKGSLDNLRRTLPMRYPIREGASVAGILASSSHSSHSAGWVAR